MNMTAFFSADSIGQSIDQVRARTRANHQLEIQKSYYLGSVILVRTLLAEVQRLDPQSALLNSSIQDRISRLAQSEFFHRGWRTALAVEVDLAQVVSAVSAELQNEIFKAMAEPVVIRRAFLVGPDRFVWRAQWFPTLAAAEAAKNQEIRRLRVSKLELTCVTK